MRRLRAIAFFLAGLVAGGCMDTQSQGRMAQAVTDMESQLSTTEQDVQTLTTTLDSLRGVVAYQDTLIKRLATLTNVPWPPPRH